jgi:hypothetical protein
MGFLTTIIVHNDALHTFKKEPAEFAKAIFEGMDRANSEHKQVSVGLGSYCNYIHVEPSRHADDETVYLHYGNSVTNLNGYNQNFEDLIKLNPDLAQKFVNRAKGILKVAQERINKAKK